MGTAALTGKFTLALEQENSIDTDFIIDKYDESLLCTVCHSIPLDPVSMECCGNIFCRDCLIKSINIAHQCPSCRNPSTIKDITPDHSIRLKISGLKLRCPNPECKHTSLIGKHGATIISHLENCAHTKLTCNECKITVKQCESKKHLDRNNLCPDRPILCEICNTHIPHSTLSMHTYSKLHVDQLHAKYTEKKHEQQSSLKEIRNLKRKIADDSIVYENQEMYAFLKTKPELYYLFLKATDGKTRRIIDHF